MWLTGCLNPVTSWLTAQCDLLQFGVLLTQTLVTLNMVTTYTVNSLLPSVYLRSVKPFIDSDTGHFECGNYIYIYTINSLLPSVCMRSVTPFIDSDTGHFEHGNYIYR